MRIRYTVRFRIDPSRVTWIAQNLGVERDIISKIIQTDSRIHARNIAREFDAAQLYAGDVEEYQREVTERLGEIFKENGILLDEFGVRSILFDPDYVEAAALSLKGEALRRYPEVLRLRAYEVLYPNVKVILIPSDQPFILGQEVLGEEEEMVP